MKNTYVKPMILVNEELSEGVYAASGAGNVASGGGETGGGETGGGETGGGSNESTGRVCGSIYMKGVFVSTDQGEKIYGGENVGARGCEGCPANWGRCAINEVNYDSDFRPWWEAAGRSPYDNANS